MKSIKILLSMLFVIAFINVNAQDEFYNEKKKDGKAKTEQKIDVKKINIDEYSTEQDYNEKHSIETSYEIYNWEEDEIYKEEQPKRRRNTVAGEVIAEVIVEVFINTAFIIAAFWH